MTPNGSLFFDEWQACLRAHYLHVIRMQDTITESTLRGVLLATGLSEDELEALHQEALSGAGIPLAADEAPVEMPVEPPPAPVDALPPDEESPTDDSALAEAALDDDEETLTPAELGTDLAPVPPEEPDAELPPDDAADEDAVADDQAPYTPAPGQLSLF